MAAQAWRRPALLLLVVLLTAWTLPAVALFPFNLRRSSVKEAPVPEAPSFPSGNRLVNTTGKLLHGLLSGAGVDATNLTSRNITDIVVFFWLSKCPNSL
jgi:hypothetical protein